MLVAELDMEVELRLMNETKYFPQAGYLELNSVVIQSINHSNSTKTNQTHIYMDITEQRRKKFKSGRETDALRRERESRCSRGGVGKWRTN